MRAHPVTGADRGPERPRLEVLTREPMGAPRPTPIVLVHGGWHGAWCWEHFQTCFAERGYASHALNLRGHGRSAGRERLRWTRAGEFLSDIEELVERLPRSPVLVGHSAGGYLVQRYLEDHGAAGAVLLASVSSRGAGGLFGRMNARHPLQAVKTHLTMDASRLIGTPSLAREALFWQQIPDEVFRTYYERLQPESYVYGWEMIVRPPRPERSRGVPVLVLGGEADAVVSVREVKETAAAYGTDAVLFPGMCHDMMLDENWRAVAERIVSWVEHRGF